MEVPPGREVAVPRLRLPEVSAGLGGTAHVKEAEGSTARKVILSECGWCVDALLFLLFFFFLFFPHLFLFSLSLPPLPLLFLKKNPLTFIYSYLSSVLASRQPGASPAPVRAGDEGCRAGGALPRASGPAGSGAGRGFPHRHRFLSVESVGSIAAF